uniref:WWE domain-containing protein n=1 Tax=viral metagenome TaxID=1070528 RepID=A0A6C0F654_9ZZZZ|tara:strand:- start:7260 stop:7613 length:354 start_codon:yes stop_codon:yes gene_type:complete
MKYDMIVQMALCGASVMMSGFMYYYKNNMNDKTEVCDEILNVTKEPTRTWYKYSNDGVWVQFKPEMEAKIEEAYMTNEDMIELGTYNIHFDSSRDDWKYWIENTEKHTFTKIKYETT